MRNNQHWVIDLREELVALEVLYGVLPMEPRALLETELVLTLLVEHFPQEAPDTAWALLNGQPFPPLTRASSEAQAAVARVRLSLQAPLSRSAWQQLLAQYRLLADPYPLYRIEATSITPTTTAVLARRNDVLRSVLQARVPIAKRALPYAGAGRWRFTAQRDTVEVEIPQRLAVRAPQTPRPMPEGKRQREPLTISLEALATTARWMDTVLGEGDWADRIQRLQLQQLLPDGMTKNDALTLDGVLHLLGMVGSGKSSLFSVLSVHLARQEYKVVLVLTEVASVLKVCALLDRLHQADERIYAVPLVGRSGRVAHLNRLHRAEAEQGHSPLANEHAGFAMLSTVCPLDGLRRDSQPIPVGQEPCTRLYPANSSEEPAIRHACPLIAACPTHLAQQRLLGASIWVTTPAALLAASTLVPLYDESLKMAELAMRAADVVLIDEADLVQMQLDDRFAQIEVLVGPGESWLDRLYQQVTSQVYRPGRPLVGRRYVDRWLAAHANTQRAVDVLYGALRVDNTMRAWLKQGYFSGDQLLARWVDEVRTEGGASESFAAIVAAVADDPLGRHAHDDRRALSDIARRLLLGDTTAQLLPDTIAALTRQAPLFGALAERMRERLAVRFLVALVVAVLDVSLREVLALWPEAAQQLELDQGSGSLFFAPADSLVRILPEPPMGTVIGFQYYAPDGGADELRFFQVRAMGRVLLHRLHNAYHLSDGIVGPHVVLTSGTSWAPASWRYHLAIPPGAILLPTREEQGGTVTCLFEPLPHPDPARTMLTVSGAGSTGERLSSLKEMVRQLAQRRGPRRVSAFDRELALLPEQRRRILLVVGSYAQAEAVALTLSDALGAQPGEQVVALIPDSEGEIDARTHQLLRSQAARLPSMGATFLVAPLAAIERGHNIVIGQESAIGSVYFLTRPLPVPGDPYTAVQRVNAWAIPAALEQTGETIGACGVALRREGQSHWTQELTRELSYRGTGGEAALLWTQLVLVWQCIGRLLRGGTNARVHFVDAKWAEVSAGITQGAYDTAETSMLVGFRDILRRACADTDPVRYTIARALYGPFLEALEHVDRLHTEGSQ